MVKSVHDILTSFPTTWLLPCRGVHLTMSWAQDVVGSMSWGVVVDNSNHVVDNKNDHVLEGCRGHHLGGVVECKNNHVVGNTWGCRGAQNPIELDFHDTPPRHASCRGRVSWKSSSMDVVCRRGTSWVQVVCRGHTSWILYGMS